MNRKVPFGGQVENAQALLVHEAGQLLLARAQRAQRYLRTTQLLGLSPPVTSPIMLGSTNHAAQSRHGPAALSRAQRQNRCATAGGLCVGVVSAEAAVHSPEAFPAQSVDVFVDMVGVVGMVVDVYVVATVGSVVVVMVVVIGFYVVFLFLCVFMCFGVLFLVVVM